MQETLLSIAIPTFNRASLLDKCLDSILTQISDDFKNHIELIVSDNASTDNTYDVIKKYNNKRVVINYFKNSENIGPDRNIANCFFKSNSKYLWIFSDDDFILPGYLKHIIDLLGKHDFGSVYINSLWYKNEYNTHNNPVTSVNYTIYKDPIDFIKKINYWCTFLTGNIVNKKCLKDTGSIISLYDTNLVQLSWVMPAIFCSKENVVINDQAIACLADNTGGYKLIKVFGKNFNCILNKLIKEKIIDKQIKPIINNHLINSFFPGFVLNENAKSNHSDESSIKVLTYLYWKNPNFWKKILFPYIKIKIKKINK